MSEAPIRVLIADDHPVWRQGIRLLLESQAGIDVIAEAENGVEALEMIRENAPDIVLLDMEMPELSGVEVARTVRRERLPSRIIALSSYDDAAYVGGLLEAGASGYITKDKPAALIVESVRAVARGEGRWFVQPNSDLAAPDLSARERDVLTQLANGRSNAEIADALFISENTVRNHLAKTYSKLQVGSAREAVAWAWRYGFIASR